MRPSPLGALPPLGGRRFDRIQNLCLVREADSTNELAKAVLEQMIADDTELLPTAFVASRQTAGKGRSGREWRTAPGGSLAVSLVVPWPEGPSRVRLPLSAGVVVARGIASLFGVEVRLKWPNDLLVGRRKLGGLLVEARVLPDGYGFAVIGIGVNVGATRAELEALGLPEATSLLGAGAAAGLLEGDAPLAALLSVLDAALSEAGDGLAEVPDLDAAFEAVTAHRPGDPISVHDGTRRVRGTYDGVTPDGFLRLRTPEGVETVLSGDVVAF